MITDLDCARLVAAQYAGDRSQFQLFVDPAHDDFSGVAWAAKQVNGVWVIVFEGSHDAPDWANDFRFLPTLGLKATFHRGFYHDMPLTWSTIRAMCPGRKVCCGHSLGAARADICTWLALQDDERAAAYIRWGEPAPGYGPELGGALEGIPGRSYRNVKPSPRHANEVDLVCEVPPAILDARHPQPFTDVYVEPDAAARKWGKELLAWHHFPLYLSKTPATIVIP